MINKLSLLGLVIVICTPGCEKKTVVVEVASPTPVPMTEPVARTKTLETARLGDTVDAYLREPSAENQADVKKALAKLDGEIAELEGLVANRTGSGREEAATKLENMRSYRTAEVARFQAVQAKAAVSPPVPHEPRSEADKVGDTIKHVGEAIGGAADRAGDKVKETPRP